MFAENVSLSRSSFRLVCCAECDLRSEGRRQTLLFSATMPPDIARLAAGILSDPIRVEATPPATTVAIVEQRVVFVERGDKRDVLCAMLKDPALAQWWKSYGEPKKAEDTAPVAAAGLFGGRMALQLTAAVPATMAVLYLLLILYFKMRGGYKKEVVLAATAPADEYLAAADERWAPTGSEAVQRNKKS